MSRRTTAIVLCLLVLGAGTLRAIHLDRGLPEVYEEATPAREAIGIWGEPGGAIDLNPGFFKYPSLTFYIQYSVQAVWYLGLSLSGEVNSLNDFRQLLQQDFHRAVLLGRWVQVVLGALLCIPVFFFARRLAGGAAGVTAAALVAVLPMAVRASQVVGPDTALALFTAAGLATTATLAVRGERSDYLWTGLWIGLATSAKYPGALLGAALLAAHARHTLARGGGPAALVGSGRLWQSVFIAGLVLVTTSPYLLLDAAGAWADLSFEREHMALGHLGREDGRALGFYFTQAIPGGWTGVVAAFAAVGVVLLLARRESRVAALPGAIFLALVLLVLGSWRMAASHYLLFATPVVAAWAGAAPARLAGWRTPTPRWAAAAAGLVMAALVALPLVRSVAELTALGRPDSRAAATEWIAAHVVPGSTVLTELYGPELDPTAYNLLQLPFHGVTPHIYDPAYQASLYASFDIVVLSSGVYARYQAQPREYPWQNRFYRDLQRGFREVAIFPPARYEGPTIRVLQRREDGDLAPVTAIDPDVYAHFAGNAPFARHLASLGEVLIEQGGTVDGFAVLREAVEIAPGEATVWGKLGLARLEAGNPQEALDALRRARDLAPRDPRSHLALATYFAKVGEPSQAAESYRDALEIDPDSERAFLGLARSLVADDRYAEARVVLGEFLHRFPRSVHRPAAATALQELARMGPGRP